MEVEVTDPIAGTWGSVLTEHTAGPYWRRAYHRSGHWSSASQTQKGRRVQTNFPEAPNWCRCGRHLSLFLFYSSSRCLCPFPSSLLLCLSSCRGSGPEPAPTKHADEQFNPKKYRRLTRPLWNVVRSTKMWCFRQTHYLKGVGSLCVAPRLYSIQFWKDFCSLLKPKKKHRLKYLGLSYFTLCIFIPNLLTMETTSTQCLLLPHKISPSISLPHPLVCKNRPLFTLLILMSHRSDRWGGGGKGFRAARGHSNRKITGSIGKHVKYDAAELCNSSVPTAASYVL